MINLGLDITNSPSYNDVTNSKGAEIMTDNERELIDMIRRSEDPGKALKVAVEIILLYLEQHGSSRGQEPADPREPA